MKATKIGAFAPFFVLPRAGRDQRREVPAASLWAGADFSGFTVSPLSGVDGLASLWDASFDPVCADCPGWTLDWRSLLLVLFMGITLRNGRSRGGASGTAGFEGSRARSQFSECRRCRRPCRPVLSDNRRYDVTVVRGLARKRLDVGMATSRPPCAGRITRIIAMSNRCSGDVVRTIKPNVRFGSKAVTP